MQVKTQKIPLSNNMTALPSYKCPPLKFHYTRAFLPILLEAPPIEKCKISLTLPIFYILPWGLSSAQ